MKRKADALMDTDSKRSSTEILPKEKVEIAEQNANVKIAIEMEPCAEQGEFI